MILREILSSARVGQLALEAVPILPPSESVREAASQMRSHSHGSALIVENNKLVGVFTERDLLRWLAEDRALDSPVSGAMTPDPKTVTPDETLLDCIGFLDQGGYRRLPVVQQDGTPVGIIDVKDIVHYFVEYFPAAVYNQASRERQTTSDREGA